MLGNEFSISNLNSKKQSETLNPVRRTEAGLSNFPDKNVSTTLTVGAQDGTWSFGRSKARATLPNLSMPLRGKQCRPEAATTQATKQKRHPVGDVFFVCLVPRIGLEPTHLTARASKTRVSTNFTTWASDGK